MSDWRDGFLGVKLNPIYKAIYRGYDPSYNWVVATPENWGNDPNFDEHIFHKWVGSTTTGFVSIHCWVFVKGVYIYIYVRI